MPMFLSVLKRFSRAFDKIDSQAQPFSFIRHRALSKIIDQAVLRKVASEDARPILMIH